MHRPSATTPVVTLIAAAASLIGVRRFSLTHTASSAQKSVTMAMLQNPSTPPAATPPTQSVTVVTDPHYVSPPDVIDTLVEKTLHTANVITAVLDHIESGRFEVRDVRRLQICASMLSAAARELEHAAFLRVPTVLRTGSDS